MPNDVEDLIRTVHLRWIAQKIGFEKLTLKNNTLKGQFPNSEKHEYFNSERFGKVVSFLQANPKFARLKEINRKQLMIFDDVESIDRASVILSLI